MPDWIWLAAGILASYRVARMLAVEEGPFALFERVRARLGGEEQATWLGRGVACPLCIGFYISFVMALLVPAVSIQAFVLDWLAVAGGMTILHLWIERE